MAKTVWNRSKRDAKELGRIAKVGDVFYTVAEVSRHVAPYEDSRLYSEHVVKFIHPLMGGAMIAGSQSVEGLVLREGPVYTEPPKGIRNIADPGPQVAGPLAGDEHRELSAYEIRRAQKQVEADEGDRKRKRGSWF